MDKPKYLLSSQGMVKLKWAYLLSIVAFVLTSITVILLFYQYMMQLNSLESDANYFDTDNRCELQLVESIPENLNFSENSPAFMSTYDSWKLLMNSTKSELNIASFYWTLLGTDVVNDTSDTQGEDIFKNLMKLGTEGKIKIRIAQSAPSSKDPDFNTQILQQKGAAEIRSLNLTRLLGNGVLHTKFWISDRKHVYIGSANMDWRSLTQVKEMGILALNCPTIAGDLEKIFEEYWMLGSNTSSIPKKWPSKYSTQYNFQHTMNLYVNNKYHQSVILSSSPPPLTASGRVDDIAAILNIISSADRFIKIAVMDYYPLMIYTKNKTYWPIIDDAIRSAAVERKVEINMLISWWNHSDISENYFLRSLQDLSHSLPGVNIQIKSFIVPSNEEESRIPYGRVNHNKYMVTDNVAYIGTSNWSGDYFTNTAGVGIVLLDTPEINNASTIRKNLLSVFERDWNSRYAEVF